MSLITAQNDCIDPSPRSQESLCPPTVYTLSELKQEWKTHEVRSDRQVDFLSQLRLMKSFEDREAARKAWVRRERILNRRQRWTQRIAEFSGKKLPYSFGLIDMALVMNLLESAGLSVRFSGLTSYVMSLLA